MSKFESSNQGPGAPTPGEGSILLQRFREATVRSAAKLLSQALDVTDDTLFGFSEKADTAARSALFMDAMRSIRVKRPALEQVFREHLTGGFLELTRRARFKAAEESIAELAADSLSLVEHHDLEEDLAFDAMANKANGRHKDALFALGQRLTAIAGVGEIDVEANPIGPPAVCRALRAMVAQIETDITVKLVLLKLLDRHVATDLDQVYEVGNKLLAEAGVLPNIRFARPTRPRSSAEAVAQAVESLATNQHESSAPSPDAAAPATGGSGDAGTNEVVAAFASLLASRRQQGGAVAPQPAGPNLSNAELIHALARLQAQQTYRNPGASEPGPTLIDRVERVKQDLLGQLRTSGIEKAEHRVAAGDEDAIDLVSMLFQFVVQDRSLPSEIKALLSRLQIPYVRVAIKDKRLFAQAEHPARRLLDAFSTASIGWSAETDRDGRFLSVLTHLVERVITDYADDFRLFEHVLAEFEAFVERQTRQSDSAERRAAEAANGREKLALARRAVTQLVENRLAHRSLPPLAREVISSPWSNYLVLTYLRQGPDSNEWKSAVSFIDAVIWSSLPKNDDSDRAKLTAMVPQMQHFLRRGLGVVGFGESEAERLVQGFGAVFVSLHTREVALEQAETIAAAELSLTLAPPSPVAAADPEPETPDASYPDDDEFSQRARSLKIGTWVEFSTESGAPECAKVSWISPMSARLLFVNRKGLKVAEFSVFALANELRAGTAQILEVAPIFERALSSIMNRLKYEHMLASGGARDGSQQSA